MLSANAGATLDATMLEEKIQPQLWATVDKIVQEIAGGDSLAALSSLDLSGLDLTNVSTARVDSSGSIHVYAEMNSFEPAALESIEALGLTIVSSSELYGAVEIWAPHNLIDDLASLTAVNQVRMPSYGVARAGSVNSAGDGLVNADDVRSRFASKWDRRQRGSRGRDL